MFSSALLLLAGSALAEQREFYTLQPSGTFNPAAATAVQTEYPKDHHIVKGRYVDHLWHIVLDSASYDDAHNNADLQALEKQGLLLTNYYAVESNSQANYLAMIGGDTFGLTEERFVSIPSNISTLADSMQAAAVLWAQYAEDQPITAYQGWEYTANGASYSRAKNPFVAFDSVLETPSQYVNLRSLATMKYDFSEHKFPQWLMIRPNLENDGTNSNLETAAKWVRDFIEPHIETKKAYHRKLFLITFAHSGSSSGPNKVWSLLLGDMHQNLRGTQDPTYYDHYSIAASTQANFNLPSLGRYDCSANVFSLINSKAHIKNYKDPNVTAYDNYNQGPFVGWLSSTDIPLARPNLQCEGRGHAGLLKRVKKLWKNAPYSYTEWEHQY